MTLGPLEFIKGKTPQAQAERRLLIGGLAESLIHMSEYAMEQGVIPNYPPELKQQLIPYVPPNGELLTLISPPVVTQVAKKVVRGTDTKEKLSDISFGMMLYSIPRLVQRIGVCTAVAIGVASKPPATTARVTVPATSKYGLSSTATNFRATTVTPTRGLSKYVLTA